MLESLFNKETPVKFVTFLSRPFFTEHWRLLLQFSISYLLTLEAPIPQNGQTHSNFNHSVKLVRAHHYTKIEKILVCCSTLSQ